MKIFRRKGFTLVEIMIVVAIIGLLAAIAIPNFVRARQAAQTNACIANLKQIEGAKEVRLIDGQAGVATMANLVPAYIRRAPTCPVTNTVYPDVNIQADPPTCHNATVVGGTHPAILQ